MKRFILLLILALLTGCISYSQNQNNKVEELCDPEDQEIKVEKIWDQAPHNAFTDLIRYKDAFYCTFREGSGHNDKTNGKVRILKSYDGLEWRSVALLEKEEYSFWDPSLTVTPHGKLMLLVAKSTSILTGPGTCYVSFFNDSTNKFTDIQRIRFDSDDLAKRFNRLWRIKWYNNVAYGVVYHPGQNGTTVISLVSSSNGIDYSLVKSFDTDGRPNETALSFMPDGELIILVRREGEGKVGLNGLLGRSKYPYQDWEWADVGFRIGGPNLITIPKGPFIIGTRIYSKNGSRTGLLCNDSAGKFRQFIELPSGGDNSYPGLLIFRDSLFVSYYSSHEGKTSIYMAKIPMKKINRLIGDDARSPFSQGDSSQ